MENFFKNIPDWVFIILGIIELLGFYLSFEFLMQLDSLEDEKK